MRGFHLYKLGLKPLYAMNVIEIEKVKYLQPIVLCVHKIYDQEICVNVGFLSIDVEAIHSCSFLETNPKWK